MTRSDSVPVEHVRDASGHLEKVSYAIKEVLTNFSWESDLLGDTELMHLFLVSPLVKHQGDPKFTPVLQQCKKRQARLHWINTGDTNIPNDSSSTNGSKNVKDENVLLIDSV